MHRYLASVVVLGLWLVSADLAFGQETPSAKATRKRLQEKITVEIKETPFKEAVDEIRRELNNKVSFKIDNVSGLSNNSKVTVIAKDKTVEAILNELADKYDFGYFILSNEKDRYNGWIILRKYKDKERGYEAGKEPKKESSSGLLRVPPWHLSTQRILLALQPMDRRANE